MSISIELPVEIFKALTLAMVLATVQGLLSPLPHEFYYIHILLESSTLLRHIEYYYTPNYDNKTTGHLLPRMNNGFFHCPHILAARPIFCGFF